MGEAFIHKSVESLDDILNIRLSQNGSITFSINAQTTPSSANALCSHNVVSTQFNDLFSSMENYLCTGRYDIQSAVLTHTISSLSLPTNMSFGIGTSSSYVLNYSSNYNGYTAIGLALAAATDETVPLSDNLGVLNFQTANKVFSLNGGISYLIAFQNSSSAYSRSNGYNKLLGSDSNNCPRYCDVPSITTFGTTGGFGSDSFYIDLSNSDLTKYNKIGLAPVMVKFTNASIQPLWIGQAWNFTIGINLICNISCVQKYK